MNDVEGSVLPEIDREIVTNTALDEKYRYCYPVLMQCLLNELEGKKIHALQEFRGSKTIGLYAVNEFMDYLIGNLIKADIEIRLYDKRKEAFSEGYRGYEVNSYEQAVSDYHKSLIDKIVICNLTHGISIAEGFIADGVPGNDIRLVDMLVYGMGGM